MVRRRRPWFIWIFFIFLRFVCRIVDAVGRLAAIVLGTCITLVGFVFSCTIVGAIVGIPLMFIGVLLIFCGFSRRKRRHS